MTKPLSQNAIGRALGLSSSTMVKMRKAGCPMDSVASVEAWRKEHLNVAWCKPTVPQGTAPVDGAAQTGGGGGMPRGRVESFNSARTREKIAEADRAEMEAARLRGLYLVKADFERHLFNAGRMLRDTLTNCARRIGAEVAGLTSPEDCEQVIDREHRAALASFSQNLHLSLKLDIGAVQAPAASEVKP
ncbi:hypothetical protein LHU53_12425 [Rhodoferax sp. U2-2l]|uniref:hypothetical protein n=1 Tax=Rhodoferax sp. U2-2l TaxID=2884000 RepID=UPI001D0A34C2|nr:hypothetical protein [Rhodoferax sp. U2-2l]MCB8747710.1 hypothetical protein [Rhodoferax sp. U2-2l]